LIDATFVEAPRQRNNRDDNATIKNGEVPEDWSEKKKAHKDTDARWTKKGAVGPCILTVILRIKHSIQFLTVMHAGVRDLVFAAPNTAPTEPGS
jgi:hypothetical protein